MQKGEKIVARQALNKLRSLFPYQRAKLGESLEEIHRREGKEDVLKYIEDNMV
jgi:hypothetical protein